VKDFANPSLRFETDFFRQKNNLSIRRDRKMRSLQIRTLYLLLAVGVLSLAGLVSYRIARYLLTCDRLNVHQFSLHNAPRCSAERLAAVLKETRGNILLLSVSTLRNRLLQIPEIADVSITRLLPDTIALRFELRTPVYALEENGTSRLFDREGREISRSQRPMPGLIRVQGISAADLPKVAALGKELARLGPGIESVTYETPYGLTLRRVGHTPLFSPGEDHFLEKLAEYDRIQSRLPWPEASIRRVDLRIAGRIYFEGGEEETTADEK